MNRGAHSFFAAFASWLVPFLGFMVWMQFGNGSGYITDFKFLFFWPLLFTFIGWLFVGLPLVFLLQGERFRSLLVTVLVAVASTTLVFLGIAALFQFGLMAMIWWPVLIGLIGGTIFWVLQKYQPLRGWIFWILPIVFPPLFDSSCFPME